MQREIPSGRERERPNLAGAEVAGGDGVSGRESKRREREREREREGESGREGGGRWAGGRLNRGGWRGVPHRGSTGRGGGGVVGTHWVLPRVGVGAGGPGGSAGLSPGLRAPPRPRPRPTPRRALSPPPGPLQPAGGRRAGGDMPAWRRGRPWGCAGGTGRGWSTCWPSPPTPPPSSPTSPPPPGTPSAPAMASRCPIAAARLCLPARQERCPGPTAAW